MSSHLDKSQDETGRLDALARFGAMTRSSKTSYHQVSSLIQLVLDSDMATIGLVVSSDKQNLKSSGDLNSRGPRVN